MSEAMTAATGRNFLRPADCCNQVYHLLPPATSLCPSCAWLHSCLWIVFGKLLCLKRYSAAARACGYHRTNALFLMVKAWLSFTAIHAFYQSLGLHSPAVHQCPGVHCPVLQHDRS
jgi:hypothetical protein